MYLFYKICCIELIIKIQFTWITIISKKKKLTIPFFLVLRVRHHEGFQGAENMCGLKRTNMNSETGKKMK